MRHHADSWGHPAATIGLRDAWVKEGYWSLASVN